MIPAEILASPVPLIGLSGLDLQGKPVHKSIWEAFNNNRKTDRSPIQFKLLSPEYEFPVSKPKRQSYEWYSPKGILKRNWLLKHLHVLPAVVVLFQELEWNDPQWTEKQVQCVSAVQYLRNVLQPRQTRIVLVLLQKGGSVSGAVDSGPDDALASERITNLSSVCDINAKFIFVLHHNEHLLGHIIRLENAFLDIAQGYYSAMMKQVKSHRDQIQTDHQMLKIRHQFKLGFISEMRNDLSSALKYYNQAYLGLDEIPLTNVNCVELKTVAGFTSYKICKLMFKLNIPRDAINQFKGHIDKYRHKVGFKDLAFEHYAWLSVQYSAFAELFCEVIKDGLKAIQTQHPGIYYDKAAEYMSRRKESFKECYALADHQVQSNGNNASSLSIMYNEFYGVRSAKNVGTTGEPMSEQQMIALIQENEKNFNHSAAIITLLGQAMAQFKVYKCLRFRKKLAIDMAEEYFNSGDHAKALTLYSLMLTDYRSDNWNSIFTRVLLKTLRSAYLSVAIQDFIATSVEAMSPKILIERAERVSILENLWKVFQSVAPVSASQITPELKQSWEQALQAMKQPLIIDLDKISDIIDGRVSFEAAQIRFEDTVTIHLHLHSLVDVPLKMKHFNLIINDSKTHYKLRGKQFRKLAGFRDGQLVAETEFQPLSMVSEEFIMEPHGLYEILFTGEPKQFMENEELQIAKLEMKMGTDRVSVILTKGASLNKAKTFNNYSRHTDLLDHIPIRPHCYITPTFHLTTSIDQQSQPMLVNENFKMVTTFKNNSEVRLRNVGLRIQITHMQRNKVFLAAAIGAPVQKWSSVVQLTIPDLEPRATTSAIYYVTSFVEGNIELNQRVWYEADLAVAGAVDELDSPILSLNSDISPVPGGPLMKPPQVERLKKQISNHNIKIDFIEVNAVRKTKVDTLILSCVDEIRFMARLYTLSRQALLRAYKNEDFLMRINMEVVAPIDIEILGRFFVSDHNVKERVYSKKSSPDQRMQMKKGQSIEDVRILNVQAITREWDNVETYNKIPAQLVFKESQKGATTASAVNGNMIGPGNEMKKTNSLEDFNKAADKLETGDSGLDVITKTLYNHTIDSLEMVTDTNRGFFKQPPTKVGEAIPGMFPLFGVYCVRWKRVGSSEENESKFLINGIEIVEPIINIYSYIEERMYVNIPVLFRVSLSNPSSKILHFTAILNQTDCFMFSGQNQMNISIFSHSTVDLKYNLLPLKTGWRQLPELSLEFNKTYCLPEDELQQADLNHLVARWMPKRVFIHPPTKSL